MVSTAERTHSGRAKLSRSQKLGLGAIGLTAAALAGGGIFLDVSFQPARAADAITQKTADLNCKTQVEIAGRKFTATSKAGSSKLLADCGFVVGATRSGESVDSVSVTLPSIDALDSDIAKQQTSIDHSDSTEPRFLAIDAGLGAFGGLITLAVEGVTGIGVFRKETA